MSLRFITHRTLLETSRAVRSARDASLGRWFGLGISAALVVAGSVGCGDDEKCPRGTSGNPCRFDDDAGVTPTSPPLVNDVSLDVDTQTPDIGPEPDGASDAGSDTTSESRSGVFGEDSRSQVAWLGQSAFEHPSRAAWFDQAIRGHHPYETPNAHDAHFEAGPGFWGPARTRTDPRLPLGWGEPGEVRVSLVIAPFTVAPDERQSSGG